MQCWGWLVFTDWGWLVFTEGSGCRLLGEESVIPLSGHKEESDTPYSATSGLQVRVV